MVVVFDLDFWVNREDVIVVNRVLLIDVDCLAVFQLYIQLSFQGEEEAR